jgi:hypothetical protein
MARNPQPNTRQALASHDIERFLLHALKDIRYGSLEITIHDSRVVRIERKEKIRVDPHDSSELE